MRALVRGAGAVAVLAALARAAAPGSEAARTEPSRPGAPEAAPAPLSAQCPPSTLPDNGVCIPAPSPALPDGPAVHAPVEEQIPRRPDRPEDYLAYEWPFAIQHSSMIAPGAELEAGSPQARGLTLTAPAPTSVQLVALQDQTEPARVVHIGPLLGTTVVTHHRIGRGQAGRSYLVVYAGLDAIAPEVQKGAALGEGTVIGQIASEPARLHLLLRRVRDGVSLDELPPTDLLDPSLTIATDPRNLLPLRQP